MPGKGFSPTNAINVGWQVVKKNFGFVMLLMLTLICIIFLLTGMTALFTRGAEPEEVTFLAMVGQILAGLIVLMIRLGLIRIALKIADGKEKRITDLFKSSPSLILKYIVAHIIFAIITGIGYMFLIIPGVILRMVLYFYAFIMVDLNAGPIEALKKSAQITKGSRGDLFWLSVLIFLLNLAGAMFIVVGLIVTLPISFLAITYAYRSLMPATTEERVKIKPGLENQDLL